MSAFEKREATACQPPEQIAFLELHLQPVEVSRRG
jgi:hypothetical protein